MTIKTAPTVAGTWTLVPERSAVAFRIRHLMVATVRGTFTEFNSVIRAGDTGPEEACGSVRVDSIQTGDAARDERLLGIEFFDAANNAEMRFSSDDIARMNGKFRITGKLTIKCATRDIELRARQISATDDLLELEVRGHLKRSDFGIESAQLLEAGISDRVDLELNLSFVR